MMVCCSRITVTTVEGGFVVVLEGVSSTKGA